VAEALRAGGDVLGVGLLGGSCDGDLVHAVSS
jgi:hypothetical protein